MHSKPSPANPAAPATPIDLDLREDVADLTARLMDIESVSGNETALADAIEAALRRIPGLSLHRDGDSIVARTTLGRAERVILAGHLDTVPLPTTPGARGTVPVSWEGRPSTAAARPT